MTRESVFTQLLNAAIRIHDREGVILSRSRDLRVHQASRLSGGNIRRHASARTSRCSEPGRSTAKGEVLYLTCTVPAVTESLSSPYCFSPALSFARTSTL